MRKRIILLFSLVVFLGMTFFCARKAMEPSKEDVAELLENISQSPLEVEIKAEESGINIEPGRERSQYLITLMDPEVTFSTAVYRHLDMEVPEFRVPVHMEKMVLAYSPSKKNLTLRSVEKMKGTLVLSELLAGLKDQEAGTADDLPEVTFDYSLESAELEGYDLSPLIDSGEKSLEEVLSGFVSSNKNMKVSAVGFAAGFNVKGEQERAMDLSIKEMESSFQFEPELFSAFIQEQDSAEILSGALEKKAPLVDVNASFTGVDFLLSLPEKEIQAGYEGAGFSYSLKPSEQGGAFDFSSGWNLKSVHAEGIPEPYKVLAKLNEMGFKFSIENLSPEFISAYFDLVKTAQSMRTAEETAAQQELIIKGPALGNKFIESKPIIKVSLSPLDHSMGEIEAQGEFQFIRMGPPVGKAEAKILDINKMEQNIKQSFPPEKSEALMKWIKQMFVIDESGQAVMVFELKEDDTTHFYLNGEKHAYRQ